MVASLILTPPFPLFPGGPLQNGQPSAEIQEEVALTSLGSGSAATSKRHSTSDKMHFPRASLQPITTLGVLPWPPSTPLLNYRLQVCLHLHQGLVSLEPLKPRTSEMEGASGRPGPVRPPCARCPNPTPEIFVIPVY